jgi:hypothetical protein
MENFRNLLVMEEGQSLFEPRPPVVAMRLVISRGRAVRSGW